MRFTLWQGSSEGALARIIHLTLWANRGAAIVDVEGSISELVMLLCCEDERGGFCRFDCRAIRIYWYGFIGLHNIHYQTK